MKLLHNCYQLFIIPWQNVNNRAFERSKIERAFSKSAINAHWLGRYLPNSDGTKNKVSIILYSHVVWGIINF